MSNPVILDQRIIHRNGCYVRVKRYLKGIHPGRGVVTKGLTGWETIEELDLINPMGRFHVVEQSHETQ